MGIERMRAGVARTVYVCITYEALGQSADRLPKTKVYEEGLRWYGGS